MSNDQVEQVLGEMLRGRILGMHPTLTFKIIGMLLQLDVVEILSLLNSADLLSQKVNEATEVVRANDSENREENRKQIQNVAKARDAQPSAHMIAVAEAKRNLLLLESSFALQVGNITQGESRKRQVMTDKFTSALAEMKKRALQSERDKESHVAEQVKRSEQSKKAKTKNKLDEILAAAARSHQISFEASMTSTPSRLSSPLQSDHSVASVPTTPSIGPHDPHGEAPLRDVPTESDNLRFYRNEIPSRPDGALIEDFLEKWGGDHAMLEVHHGYIQWMFPIPAESSFNGHSQPLRLHEAQAIASDPVSLNRVRRATTMMLAFYGMEFHKGQVRRTVNWEVRFKNMNDNTHNAMRVSRIVTSLGYLGLEELQLPILMALGEEVVRHKTLRGPYPQSFARHWVPKVTAKSSYDAVVAHVFEDATTDRSQQEEALPDEHYHECSEETTMTVSPQGKQVSSEESFHLEASNNSSLHSEEATDHDPVGGEAHRAECSSPNFVIVMPSNVDIFLMRKVFLTWHESRAKWHDHLEGLILLAKMRKLRSLQHSRPPDSVTALIPAQSLVSISSSFEFHECQMVPGPPAAPPNPPGPFNPRHRQGSETFTALPAAAPQHGDPQAISPPYVPEPILARVSPTSVKPQAVYLYRDFSNQEPFRYPHPRGSNTCWAVCMMELRRLLRGPTHPLVASYYMSMDNTEQDRVKALYALRETPEKGGVGAGLEEVEGVGYSHDIFEGLGTLLGWDPCGAGGQLHVFKQLICAGNVHGRTVGLTGKELRVPLLNETGFIDTEPTDNLQTEIDRQVWVESEITAEEATRCDECDNYTAHSIEQAGFFGDGLAGGSSTLEVLFVKVRRLRLNPAMDQELDLRPSETPEMITLFNEVYVLTTICTFKGDPGTDNAHFVAWRLFKRQWYNLDDLSRDAAEKCTLEDIPKTHVYAMGYVKAKTDWVPMTSSFTEQVDSAASVALPAPTRPARTTHQTQFMTADTFSGLSYPNVKGGTPGTPKAKGNSPKKKGTPKKKSLPMKGKGATVYGLAALPMKGKGTSVYGLANASEDGSESTHIDQDKTPLTQQSSYQSSHEAMVARNAGVISFEAVGKEVKLVLEMSRMEPTACPWPACRTHYTTTSVPGMKQHLLQVHNSRDTYQVRLGKRSDGEGKKPNAKTVCRLNSQPMVHSFPLDSRPLGRVRSVLMDTFDPGGHSSLPVGFSSSVAPPPVAALRMTRAEQIARAVITPAPTRNIAPLHVPPLEVEDWEVFVNGLTSRKSMRRVAHAQKFLWLDICESVCGPFQTANDEGRERIFWELLTAVKRYLYLPGEKHSARGTLRLMRDRARGSFDNVPQEGQTNDSDEARPERRPGLSRAERLVKEGALGKAARAVDTKTLPPHPGAIQRAIIERVHPEGPTSLPVNPDKTPRFPDLDWDYLSKRIRDLPRSAAPGATGWTRELLIPLVDSLTCRPVITALLLGILNNTLSDALRRTLSTSILIVITKEVSPGEEPDGRPIAMGDFFAKLAAGIAFDRERSKIAEIFGDLQFGALKKQGTETIILRTRREFRASKKHVMATLDLRNAFNALCRDIMMQTVFDYKLCDLFNIVEFLYGRPSSLLSPFAPGQQSKQGVRQGDPLGPILFALGIHPTLVSLEKDHPNVRLRAYLDDVTALGLPVDVAAFIADFTNRMARLGLAINVKKSKVATHHDAQFKAFMKSGLIHTPGGQKLLGAFVASADEQESAYLRSKVDRMAFFFDGLTQVERHCSYTLFRYCGLPRWTHLTRTHTPETSSSANELVDDLARQCLTTLMGGDTTLKVRLFSNPIHASDLLASVSFVKLAPMAYAACLNGVNGIPDTPSQHDLVKIFINKERTTWLSENKDMDPRAVVHARMLTLRGSRLWLECRPNRGEYFIRYAQWEIALRIRYLLPPTNDISQECVCGLQCSAADFVVHALSCNKVSGYTSASRHAHVKKTFKAVLSQYGFRPDAKEPRFNGKGPDVCFMMGMDLAVVDVVVINPLAESYVYAEYDTPGKTLVSAEKLKDHTHFDKMDKRTMIFFPLALTIYGQLGIRSLTLLRKCSRYTADPGGFMSHMTTALAVAVQIGNAQMVLAATHGWWENGVR